MAPEPLLPVTVLSGFLGAGKTTLLKHILRSAGKNPQLCSDAGQGGELPAQAALKVAVIVNDMGEVNLDEAEIKDSRLIQEEASMVELHNGCICCTLRGDLLKTVKALSEEKKFDYLVIESTGISEPLPVAQTFVMNVDDATTMEVPAHAQAQVKEAQEQAEKERQEADKKADGEKALVKKESGSEPEKADKEADKKEEGEKALVEKESGSEPEKADEEADKEEEGEKALVKKEAGSEPEKADKEADKEAGTKEEGQQGSGDPAPAPQPAPAPSQWRSLSHFARLDTMVTVVDALNFYDVLGSVETLSERNVAGMAGNTGVKSDAAASDSAGSSAAGQSHSSKSGEGSHLQVREEGAGHAAHGPGQAGDAAHGGETSDDRSIAQLMLDQIEFADVILLSKAHLLAERPGPGGGPAAVEKTRRLLQKLNQIAKVIVPVEPNFADLPLEAVVDTKLFDMKKAQMSPGWVRELIKAMFGRGHTPETQEYGISSVVFRTKERPFHPGRLHNLLQGFGDYMSGMAKGEAGAGEVEENPFSGVVRAKGQVWIATCNDRPVGVHAAGRHVMLEPRAQPYLASIPREQWGPPHMAHFAQLLSKGQWHATHGDRRVEMVLIGVALDRNAVLKELKAALLTKEEAEGGPESWKAIEDVLFFGKFRQ